MTHDVGCYLSRSESETCNINALCLDISVKVYMTDFFFIFAR